MRKRRLTIVVAAAALLTVGCADSVSGSAKPTTIAPPADVRPLLLDSAQFPSSYPAVVLPQQVAQQAAEDMSGLPQGAEQLSPPDCTPASPPKTPDALAVAVGTNDAERSTITVIIENAPTETITGLRDYVTRCADISARNRAAEITVHTEMLETPAEAKDAVMVWRRTVRSGNERSVQHQTMVTMVGQEGAVRVFVTYMTFGTANPDFAAMGTLLSSQISKIQHS